MEQEADTLSPKNEDPERAGWKAAASESPCRALQFAPGDALAKPCPVGWPSILKDRKLDRRREVFEFTLDA